MAKYIITKSFRADDFTTGNGDDLVKHQSPQRKKGSVVDLSGDELKFAKENSCAVKFEDN